ncbi:MAG: hypothetical protein V1816_18835 [Pseudomonadota bacterium]
MARQIDPARIVEVINRTSQPLTVADICRWIGINKPSSSDREACYQIIKELAESKKIFQHPPKKKNDKPRYYKDELKKWIRGALLAAVQKSIGQAPLTVKKLRNILNKKEIELFDEVLGDLLKTTLFTFRYRGIEYVQVGPKIPSAHLTAHHLKPLSNSLNRINEFRTKPVSLEDLFAFLDSAGPLDLELIDGKKGESIAPEGLIKNRKKTGMLAGPPNLDELFRDWYMADKPPALGPSTIPLPKTWERYSRWARLQDQTPDAKQFREWLRELYRRGKAELNYHEMPSEIPEEERKYLFDLRPGFTIYWWKYLGD